MLADEEIDAVSIVTPTFTHKDNVIAALESGKNVLCEKPPALTANDVRECIKASEKSKKLLMYGFVSRFSNHSQYMKNYIDSGKLGNFIYAEASRIDQYIELNGWFCDINKSGGYLFDAGIHELDVILYLMGYPKPKTVLGYTNTLNNDMGKKLKHIPFRYSSIDPKYHEKTMESFSSATITLDNGACIHIKTSYALNTPRPEKHIDLLGEKSGARFAPVLTTLGEPFIELFELDDDGYNNTKTPHLIRNNIFQEEINHFVDCCLNKTECICKPEDAVTLIEILNAIYKSAKLGKAIQF